MTLSVALAIAGAIALFGLVLSGLLYFILRTGREIGRTAVTSGVPWSMRASCAEARVLTLWCDVDLEMVRLPELRGPIRVLADGQELWHGTFELGRRGTTTAGSHSRVKRVWIVGRSSLRGVVRVAKLQAPRADASVTVEGTITASGGTRIRKLELFLAAR